MENADDGCTSGGCIISDSVFSLLKDVYGTIGHLLEDKELYEVIATVLAIPPLISVLRVNTTKESILSAKHHLQTKLNRQSEEVKKNYEVNLHESIADILTVTSCKSSEEILYHAKEVIVGELCGIAVLRGADVFAPGVFGAPVGMKQADEVSVYADLNAKCRRGFTQTYTGRKYFVGNGVAVLSRNELFKDSAPKGVAIRMTSSLYNLPSFDQLNSDLFFAQNLPSVLVGRNLDPQEGDAILDMCAAPGGKTTHAATLLQNNGIVVAIDKSKSKIKKLQGNCTQQGLPCVRCFSYDSTKICEDGAEFVQDNPQPPFPPETFDKIILDPPCSALGQRPQLQCNMTSGVLESFSVYQRKLFRQAVMLLKPGGVLMYSTCTMTISENENQVAWALKNFPELKLVPQAVHLGLSGITGRDLDDSNCKLVQRFDPCINAIRRKIECVDEKLSVNEDTIGFFLAKFSKCNNKIS